MALVQYEQEQQIDACLCVRVCVCDCIVHQRTLDASEFSEDEGWATANEIYFI